MAKRRTTSQRASWLWRSVEASILRLLQMVREPFLELGKLLQPIFYFINDRIGRGRSGGQAHGSRPLKPFRAQILRSLDVIHARAELTAGADQFAGVVAVGPTDDDDHVG